MKLIVRRILSIIALVCMAVFIVFLTMTLGFSTALGNMAPALASVFGAAALILFLLLKMDQNKRFEAEKRSMDEKLKEGAEQFEQEIEDGTAVVVDESEQTDDSIDETETKQADPDENTTDAKTVDAMKSDTDRE